MSTATKEKTPVDEILEATETAIDVNVSPTVHPNTLNAQIAALVGKVEAPDPLGLSILKTGRTGLKAAYEAIGSMHQAFNVFSVAQTTERGHPVTNKDGVVRYIPHERAAEFAHGLERAFARAANSIDGMEQTLNSAEADLTGRVEKALRNPQADKPTALANANAIRAYITSLPQSERFSTLSRIINDDTDPATAHQFTDAMLGVNHYTLGLDKRQAEVLKVLATEVFAKRESDQLGAIGKLRDQIAVATKGVFDAFAKYEPRIPKDSPQSTAMRRLKEGV